MALSRSDDTFQGSDTLPSPTEAGVGCLVSVVLLGESPVSASHLDAGGVFASITQTSDFLAWALGLEFKSLFLHGKCFYPLSHLTDVCVCVFYVFETVLCSPGWSQTQDPSALASKATGITGRHYNAQFIFLLKISLIL